MGLTEEVVDIARLRLEQSLRKFRYVVMGMVLVIVGLTAWLSSEYGHNEYMRQWVEQNFWPADYLLNGYAVAVLAGFLLGWAISTYKSRRSRDQAILDALRRLI